MGLLHDEFLRTNVLLLSRVHYVPLFQDLHGEGFVFVALELNLQSSRNKERGQPVVPFFLFLFRLNRLMPVSRRGIPYQLDAAKASNPQSVDDVEVGQVEVEEKGVLCFIPVTPGREGECGNRI